MPIFEYTALDSNGRTKKGSIDADNLRVARQKLKTQGIFATDIKEGREAAEKSRDLSRLFQSQRVSAKDLSITTRQLATLVGAGLPLVNALQALAEQTESSVLRRIVVDVREKVEQGDALARALASFPKAFPKFFVNMVAAGEASGTLEAVLENLADYMEAQAELRRKVMSALLYPAVMMIICTLVVSGLLIFVVPGIVEIFRKQGATLPLPTRIMIGISDFLIGYWYVVLLTVAAVIAYITWYYKQVKGRALIDGLMLRLPIYGPVYIKVFTARVSRTLGTLLSSGVGLLEGLEITRNIIANVHVRKALDDSRDGVREGRSLAKELTRSGIFPSMLGHMVAIGEKSGELEKMLVKAGKAYESEVNATLGALTSLLEPLLLVFVGVAVLSIVVSVLLPMVDLMSVLQK